ncbi:MAG: hypothetical protein RBR87_10230 [Bacteroidales bacterium]|jgi:uncharacterized membrane protein|nr:hypothetical protein [Bacteroidales bacterium]
MSHGIYIFSVYIHIVSASLWLGGMLFLILAFIPGIKNHPDKINIIGKVSLKYSKVGMVVLALLLITGIYQLEYRGMQWTLDFFTSSSFGRIAGLKILVFILITLVSLVHDHYIGNRAIEAWKSQPEHPETLKIRKLSRLMGRLGFLLALLAAYLGVLLVRGW